MGKKEDKGREHGQEWTRKEKIEQLAADIIHACDKIQSLAALPPEYERPPAWFMARRAAMAIEFQAEGILKALEVKDE